MERRRLYVLDAVCRSIATLQNARILQSSELLDFLSALSLGLEFNLITGVTADDLSQWARCFLPGHLQISDPLECADDESRDRFRADRLRELSKKISVVNS